MPERPQTVQQLSREPDHPVCEGLWRLPREALDLSRHVPGPPKSPKPWHLDLDPLCWDKFHDFGYFGGRAPLLVLEVMQHCSHAQQAVAAMAGVIHFIVACTIHMHEHFMFFK